MLWGVTDCHCSIPIIMYVVFFIIMYTDTHIYIYIYIYTYNFLFIKYNIERSLNCFLIQNIMEKSQKFTFKNHPNLNLKVYKDLNF